MYESLMVTLNQAAETTIDWRFCWKKMFRVLRCVGFEANFKFKLTDCSIFEAKLAVILQLLRDQQ